MRIKISLIIIIYLISNNLKAQFEVIVSASKANTCKDSIITFVAHATNGGVEVTDANFKWSFGDGSASISGFMLDTVTHAYSGRSGYYVRVDAASGMNSDYAIQRIQIGLKPDFTGVSTDKKDPVCIRQDVFLLGSNKYKPLKWEYNVPDTVDLKIPAFVSNSNQYKATFDYRIFSETDKITSATDINLIAVKMEHSNSSNLKIELKCPGNDTIMLKNFDATDKYLGVPIDDEGSSQAGTGYKYSWTNTPALSTMNSIIPTDAAYIEGSYTPEQAFGGLIGCPLNGSWEIIVTDNQNLDNGFVFSAYLQFNPSILPTKWEYSNTYSNPIWIGNGASSTSGTGDATAVPVAYGNNLYKFRVKDNYSCFQDTSVYITAEAASFTTTPELPTGDFPLEITFTNKTSWATKFEWNFGDGSDEDNTENPVYTYTKDGNYTARLVASTNDDCTDTAEILIVATIPELVFDKMPNTFTPNGDGANDVFLLNSGSLKGIASLDCWIYSRWGKKVAEWHSVNDAVEGWDGTIKGGPQAAPGVYYYYIKAVGYDGRVIDKKGIIELFR